LKNSHRTPPFRRSSSKKAINFSRTTIRSKIPSNAGRWKKKAAINP
jgi:hypothetical protein